MYADYAEPELRIKDEFKKSGYFWIPAKPEKKVPGTLSVMEGGYIQLELIGLFDESVEGINNYTKGNDNPKRIVGHIEGGNFVTLEDCLQTNGDFPLPGNITRSTFFAHMAMVGVAYEDEENILVNTFRFSVEGIDEWVGITGIKVEHQIEKRAASIRYTQPEDLSLNLSNGMKLLATFHYTLPGFSSLTEAKITQKTYFKLVSEQERPLSDFISSAYKITTFLSFAIDQPVCIESVYLTSKAICKDIGKDGTVPPISLYYQSLPYTETEPEIDRNKMLFGFKQIRENAESIFNKWFDAYEELSPALGLYFATRTGAYQLSDGKFLALAQGLEVYHRRTSKKEKSLRERVAELIEPFSRFLGTKEEQENLKNTITDTRNYLTHYKKSLESRAATGKNLRLVYIKMEAILQLHILKMLGFTDVKIDSVYRNSHNLQNKLERNK